jgi:hypothetical protein
MEALFLRVVVPLLPGLEQLELLLQRVFEDGHIEGLPFVRLLVAQDVEMETLVLMAAQDLLFLVSGEVVLDLLQQT